MLYVTIESNELFAQEYVALDTCNVYLSIVASFTNPRLAKRPLVFNGRLANCGLIPLVKGAQDADYIVICSC